MEEQTQNSRSGAADPEKTVIDPEKTLVAPRFDAREVVTAQPVVPLADAPAVRRAERQGSLPILLILVSALVGGLVSVFAYRLYQQRAQQPSAQEQPVAEPQVSQSPAPEVAAGAATVETRVATPEVVEKPQPTPSAEVAEVRQAVAPEDEAEREEARDDRAGRDLETARNREAREEQPARRGSVARRPSVRRVEEITTPTDDLRIRRGRYDGQEATDYEVPRRTRSNRRAERREGERNIDRVRAIFEGPPPAQ